MTPANKAIARLHSLSQRIFFLSAMVDMTTMVTAPLMAATVLAFSATRWPETSEPKDPSIAEMATIPTSPLSPLDILVCMRSILSAKIVAKMIQPIEPVIIVQSAFEKAVMVMGSMFILTPVASVPIAAAISSNMTDPMYDKRIQAMGAPTATSSARSPDKMTTDGPKDAMKLLRMAAFNCSCFSPILRPVA